MKKKIISLLISCLLLACLTGCSNKKATITTTVYAVKYIVEQLAGDRVDVEYISSDGFIQRATLVDNYKDILANTTLFVYIGELEPYLDIHEDVLTGYDFDVINLASLSAIYDFKRYTKIDVDEEISLYKESSYYDSDLFAEVDTYSKDPFIWLDPMAASSVAYTIKDWLQDYYPEDSLIFENNFKALQASFVRMDAEYQELKKINNIKLVTVTASFGNWQKLCGVEVYPLILSKYGVLPTSEQLEVIKQRIKDDNVKYIVYDDNLPEDMLELYQQVKEELNLKEISLSSISCLSAADIENGKDYITKMWENLTNLEKEFK